MFGAGLLEGWSETGQRPDFDAVMGTSVGALIAPFAFRWTDYDPVLRDIFAELEADDLHEKKSMFAMLTSDSTMSSQPLGDLIDRHFDHRLLEDLALDHENGRRLYVGTTNIDSGVFVIWNLGAIAVRRNEEARLLACRVLHASAGIPMFYSPVTFDALGKDSGQAIEELHVDGAAVRPMFLPNQVFDCTVAAADAGVR